MNTLHWTVLVIFYVISLHTVANHSDDHTAVNITNVCVNSQITTPHMCTGEDAGVVLQQCLLARPIGRCFFTLTRIP